MSEDLTDARDLAICISALVQAERNPYSPLIQRLTHLLARQQSPTGSWNEELWDTVWAAKALADSGHAPDSNELRSALRFLEATRDPITGAWYDEPFETMLVLDLLARLAPEMLVEYWEMPVRWLESLQRVDGAVIGIRYTGMAASLFFLLDRLGIGKGSELPKRALKFIRDDLQNKSIWTSEAWSNYYPLSALLDSGATPDDPVVTKAVEWFISSQDADGKWKHVSRVHDSAMAITALSRLLKIPLVNVSDPRNGILSVHKENGTIRVSFHGPTSGAIAPAERLKISSKIRDDLGRNQQVLLSSVVSQLDSRSPLASRGLSITESIQEELEKSGRYAYGHLIPARIQLLMESSLADHLRLDIDERLIDLPWELIHDGNEFVCLRYAIGRRLISDHDFTPPRPAARLARNAKVLIVSDTMDDLPAAKEEGKAVSKLLGDECGMKVDEFTSHELSKKEFLLSLKDYDIVHFAGHAFHEESSPDESYIAFADGEIQAFEIARFITNRAPTVVFLNACWSAEEMRNPESYSPMMRGLGRTFLYAGVGAFIGYLIPVPDNTATHFAISFYTSIAQGQTIGEAIRQARIASRNLKADRDLTCLSAVLYGDPSVRAIDVSP
ncbi:MAG: CHAT domain-containing protein [Chloracidobacterium sp.]|nr:CHAT domain-containing protein [Chloracidobacterium sp.]